MEHMTADIYYREWDGRSGSHRYLETVIKDYFKTRGRSCPGNLTYKRKGEFGKPFIEELPELSFSISHSGKWWFCAVSETEVGLDVQELRAVKQEKLARRFFHPDEISWMETYGFEHFTRIWTYKESYVKYTGLGLTRGMDYFSVADILTGELGEKGVCQQEIPFWDDFWVVLTAGHKVEIKKILFTE